MNRKDQWARSRILELEEKIWRLENRMNFGDRISILNGVRRDFLPLDGSEAMRGSFDINGKSILNFYLLDQKYGITSMIRSSLYGFSTLFYARPTAGNTIVARLGSYQIGGAGDWYPQFGLDKGRLLGDLDVSADSIGPLLIDRTTALKRRLFIDAGVLNHEAV